MRICKMLRLVGCVALLSLVSGSRARADEWNRKTTVTFNDPVEIPGQVLPAGTYLFQLANTADRHIVQIWTGDGSQLIATLMTVPDARPEATEASVFEFDERPGDSPQALRSWFCPGALTGEEFVVYWNRQ